MTTHALPRTASHELDDHHRKPAAGYWLALAQSAAEVLAAQRLRHQVFAGEFGSITPGPVGLDTDDFDEYCDHLLIWHQGHSAQAPQVVATYRMLPPGTGAPGRYTDTEFDLAAISPLLQFTVETGRSCVHRDHRNGATMALLWGGIADYMLRGGHRYLLGCASIPLVDGGVVAAGVWKALQSNRCARTEFSCPPRRPWEAPAVPATAVAVPPLLKAYLRLGARVLGSPAHDPAFNTADFPILLDMQTADQRYLRHFLGQTPTRIEQRGEPMYRRECER